MHLTPMLFPQPARRWTSGRTSGKARLPAAKSLRLLLRENTLLYRRGQRDGFGLSAEPPR